MDMPGNDCPELIEKTADIIDDAYLRELFVETLRGLIEHYRCPHFRILIIGRANAGKTTILEKLCGGVMGGQPIIVFDKMGKLDIIPMYFLIFYSQVKNWNFLNFIWYHQWRWINSLPWVYSLIALNHQRGLHDIEDQITYDGSNFIFHDSQGFESGAKEEIQVVWDFIEKRSAATKMKDQLHSIWYHAIWSLPK